MIKEIISTTLISAVIIGLSGCVPSFTPNAQTVNYAKKNQLLNKDYQESEIMCISDKPLTQEDKGEIFSLVSVRFHADFSTNQCKFAFSAHATKSEPEKYKMHQEILASCLDHVYYSIAESERSHYIKYSDTAYKVEFRHYKGVDELFNDGKVNKLYGYLGFEDRNNQTIVYVADTTQDAFGSDSKIGYIKEGVLNYMKEHPSKCRAFK